MQGMGILEVFGLQVLLEDKTSENAQRVSDSLKRMGVVVEDVERSVYGSFQRMESVMHSGFQIHLWGQRIVQTGQAIANVFKQVSLGTLKTSGEFERLRTRLNVLYDSAEKGEEMFQWGVQGALKTPFSVKDYVDAIANFKAVNIDPQWQFMNERQNKMQDMITFAGDLAAGTGKKINDAYFSMKEAIAGNDWVSLKRRFDGITKDMVESVTGMVVPTGGAMSDIEKRAEILTKYIGMRFGGMTEELGKTLEGLVSRAKENLQIFLMMVGDAGFFSAVKKEMEKLISFIEGNQEKLRQFAKVVSDSLTYILTPLAKLADMGQRFALWFADFSVAHPILARTMTSVALLTSGLLTLTGVAVMLGGSLITMIASLATLALNMKFSHGSTKLSSMIFQGFGKIILSLTWNMMKLAGLTTVFSMMWTHNMGGIQDSTKSLITTVVKAYEKFQQFLKFDLSRFTSMINGMKHIDNTTYNLTRTFLKAYYTIAGFFDYLTDGKVSKDTVMRLNALGALGWLETLIKIEMTIRSIFEGIGQTFTGIWTTLKKPFEWLYNRLKDIAGFVDRLLGTSTSQILENEVSTLTGKQSYSGWQNVGKIVGGVIASVVALKLAKSLASPVVAMMKMNEMIKKAVVASKSIQVSDEGNITTKRFTRNRYERDPITGTPKVVGKHKLPTTIDVVGAPLTWKNILMQMIGSKYERGRGYLYTSDEYGNESNKLTPAMNKYNQKKQEGLDILERETQLLKARNAQQAQGNNATSKANKRRLGALFDPLALALFGVNEKMGGMKRTIDVVGKKITRQPLSTKMQKGVAGSDAYIWKQLKERLNPTTWGTLFWMKGQNVLDKISPDPNKKSVVERVTERIVTTKENAKQKVTDWIDLVKDIGKGFVGFLLGALSSTKTGAMLTSRLAPVIAWAIANPLTLAIVGLGALIGGVLTNGKLATAIYNGFWTGVEWLTAGMYIVVKGIVVVAHKAFTALNDAFVSLLVATGKAIGKVIEAVKTGDFASLTSGDFWKDLGKDFRSNLSQGLENLVNPLFDLNAGISDKIYKLNQMTGLDAVDWGETGWKNYSVQHENNKVMQPIVSSANTKTTNIEANLHGLTFALEKQKKINGDVKKLTETFVAQSKTWTDSLQSAYVTGNLSTEDLMRFYQVYTDSVDSTLAQLKLAYERGQITAEDRTKIESLITQHQAVKKQMVDTLATGLSKLQQSIKPEIAQFTDKLKSEVQKFITFTPITYRTPVPKVEKPSLPTIQPNGKHKSGLDRVPYDGYIAELHAGEAVLRREDADLFRRHGIPDFSKLTDNVTPSVMKVQPATSTAYDQTSLETASLKSRSMSNGATSTKIENNYHLDTIEFSFPNVTDSSTANDLIQELRSNPALVKALQGALQQATKTEEMMQRKTPNPTWGIRRV